MLAQPLTLCYPYPDPPPPTTFQGNTPTAELEHLRPTLLCGQLPPPKCRSTTLMLE